jgi:dimethylargininase
LNDIMSKCFTFTHAITRRPSPAVTSGLRAEDVGDPDPAQFAEDHARYIETLRAAGAKVTELPPLDDFPDSVFVEDAALCLPEGAVMMRPGAPSRLGEAAAMAPTLADCYGDIRTIARGHIEGGDILVTDREILVGLSARTDAEGVEALREAVADWGHTVRVLQTPPDVLHFKTDCGLLDADTILATPRLATSGCFDGYRVLHTAEGEEASANCVRFNDVVLFPRGFPRTAEMLRGEGYTLAELPNEQAAMIDGGMSCLSLRFTPSP